MSGAGGSDVAGSVPCPRCGTANQIGFQFCTNCGSSLSGWDAAVAGSGYAAPPGSYRPPGYAAGPPAWDGAWGKEIGRTKNGTLLLLIGFLLAWIPVIALIGGILSLIGAILLVLGRKAFGVAHSRNVVISVVLLVVGIIGIIVLAVAFVSALISAAATAGSSTALAAAFRSAFDGLLIGSIVLGAIAGFASVLFTYALQSETGRFLLWSGYGASIGVQVAIYAIISAAVGPAIAEALAGGTFNQAPLAALEAQINLLGILSVIPSVLFAAAYYIAWSRVSRGEVRPASGGPGYGAPPAWPPPAPQASPGEDPPVPPR